MHSAHHERSVEVSLVEIVMLLHIYCTKVLVVKLYYNTYISQLWSGDSNQISKKGFKNGGKRSHEGFRGVIILLFLAKVQSLSLGQRFCGLARPASLLVTIAPCGRPPLCWIRSRSHCWDEDQGLAGTSRVISTFTITFISMPSTFMMKCERHFVDGNTKDIYQSLKSVSVHYRNKAWIKHIGVDSF